MGKLSAAVTVRYRDLDAMGHVNYAAYLTFLEEAVNALWEKVLSRIGMQLIPTKVGFVTAHAEIDYRRQALLGQALEVKVWVTNIGRTSFVTSYEVQDGTTGVVFAEARTVQVVTLGDGKKPMADEIRVGLSAFME